MKNFPSTTSSFHSSAIANKSDRTYQHSPCSLIDVRPRTNRPRPSPPPLFHLKASSSHALRAGHAMLLHPRSGSRRTVSHIQNRPTRFQPLASEALVVLAITNFDPPQLVIPHQHYPCNHPLDLPPTKEVYLMNATVQPLLCSTVWAEVNHC